MTGLPPPRSDWALFLDFDGSLVELAETPDSVRVDPGLPGLIERLSQVLDGAVAVISGRTLKQLDGLLGLPGLPAAGIHGLERRRADGTVTHPPLPATSLHRVKRALEAFASDRPGLLVEDKGVAVALHYRRAPDAQEACREAAERAVGEHGPGLVLLEGKRVFEIRPQGADKGSAIEAFLAEPPFRGRTPVFCGDDVTDEDGFALVNGRGGISIRIGEAARTQACWQIASPARLLAWLATIPAALTADDR